jgi:hypothetical protein
LYINDLPKLISDISKPVLFAEDTSIIVSDADPMKFKLSINKIFKEINIWFQSNLLSLNYGKTYFLQLLTKNSHTLDTQVSYVNKQITNSLNITFLGLNIVALYLGKTISIY